MPSHTLLCSMHFIPCAHWNWPAGDAWHNQDVGRTGLNYCRVFYSFATNERVAVTYFSLQSYQYDFPTILLLMSVNGYCEVKLLISAKYDNLLEGKRVMQFNHTKQTPPPDYLVHMLICILPHPNHLCSLLLHHRNG